MSRKSDNTNRSPYIFTKKININYKLVPFNTSFNDVGKTKYLPPIAKEWKSSVYNYNPNNTINYPIYDLNINSLIKSYFNLYFNHRYINHKYISRKKKRKSFNKIFVSKAEIKHTNSKAIITIYIYNREKLSLLKKIRKLRNILVKFIVLLLNKNKLAKFISLPWIISNQNLINNSSILWTLANYKVRDDFRKVDNMLYIRMKRLAKNLYKLLTTIRRYRLKLSLNKYKLEEQFLCELSQLISKYYSKKVEFNIVNLKSIAYNGDIFTEILTSKIKKEKSSPILNLNALLSKIVLPKVNTIIERGRLEKIVDLELVDNKFRNLNVCSIINNPNLLKDNINKLLYDIYYKTTFEKESKLNEDVFTDNTYHLKIRDIILENINYKNMGGARLIVKGRLTKRYRADRAVYKMKWKGGLKNIDSAFKGLSTVQYLGYRDSNVTKSSSVSKRRIGSFGVSTWIGGKNYSTLARRENLSTIHSNAISNI